MRAVGQNAWVNLNEYEEGEVIFEKAKYLGEEEGSMGAYHVFQCLETKQCWNMGAGHLNYLCGQISEGDVIRLTYNGKPKLKTGKWKGKEAHNFTLEIYEEEDLDDVEVPAKKEKPESSRKASSGSKPSVPKKKAKEVEEEEDDSDDDEDEEEEVKPAKKGRGRPAKPSKPSKPSKPTKKVVEEDEDEEEDDDELADL